MKNVICGRRFFNAKAFARAGYLFQYLYKTGYDTEIKRHKKALENLQAVKEQFLEQETKCPDRAAALTLKIEDFDMTTKYRLKI